MIYRLLYTSLFIILFFSITAQTKFTNEPNEFFSQLSTYATKSSNQKAIAAVNQFIENGNNGTYSLSQIEAIVKNCNTMRAQKMVAKPHFEVYFSTLNVVAGINIDSLQRNNWVKAVTVSIENSGKSHINFLNFMQFSEEFFSNRMLYNNEDKVWQHSSEDYEFNVNETEVFLAFKEGALTGRTTNDELRIEKTSGKFYPFENKWEGTSGILNWANAGLAKDTVFASFGNYVLDIEKSSFAAKNATFTYLNLLSKPLKGDVSGKLLVSSADNKLYPQFTAYEKVKLNNLSKGLVYEGRFGLQGNTIICEGDSANLARIEFNSKNNALKTITTSQRFEITYGETINAKAAKLLMRFGQDSIYHPNLSLSYNIKNRELKLLRPDMKGLNVPYYNSYHNLDFKVDAIYWHIDSTFIRLNMIGAEGGNPAEFESTNYFEKRRIQKYRSFTDINPIYELKAYVDKRDVRKISAAAFADMLGANFTAKSVKQLLLTLAEDGFIFYNQANNEITIKDKLIHYGLADRNRTDFDAIKILSSSKKENASFNFVDKTLKLSGVEDMIISKAKEVILLPRNEEITLLKNRDMKFSGTVLGGRVDFVGENFKFDYNNFTIDLPNMQEMVINYPNFQMTKGGQSELEPLLTSIENISGTLYIDKPTNKSGIMGNRDYSKFKSEGFSYTYYDKDQFKRLYRRDSFYFELKPFQLDSLWLLSPELISLPGKLVSGGIFEDIDQNLSIQLDRSLGFKQQAPKSGYKMYNGAGLFKGELILNNKGLNGKGAFNALTAELESDSIIFFPDSILAGCDTFYLDKKTVPHQPFTYSNGPVNINWQAKKDTLNVGMRKHPFSLYENTATLKGDLLLSSTGLYGRGELFWKEGNLKSNYLKLMADEAESQASDLTINAFDTAAVAFATTNVAANINFTEGKGAFKSAGNLKIDLPYNNYQTTMNAFDWDIKNGLIELYTPQNEDKSYYFRSTDKNREDLKFAAKSGLYNLNNYYLKAYQVPHIIVGNSKIIPDSATLTIQPSGTIQTLTNATIFTDTIFSHKVYNATVDIKTGKEFEASGTYDYISLGNNVQPIYFNKVLSKLVADGKKRKSDNLLKTTATGTIEEEQNFKLNEQFDFKGNVGLVGNKSFLNFDGFTKINLNTPGLASNWFRFKDEIDPENVQINIDENLIGINNDTLSIGINFNRGGLEMYTVFINRPMNNSDHKLIKAKGFIDNDKTKNLFSIGNKAKILGEAYQGSVFQLDDKRGIITTEGKINMGNRFHFMKVDVAGQIENSLSQNTFKFNDLVAGFEFLFDDDLLKIMANTFQDENEEAEDIDFTTENFKKGIAEFLKPKDVEEALAAIDRVGYYQKGKDVKYNFLLADLDMAFNEISRTIVSTKPFGIAYIGDKYVNRMVMGYAEFGTRAKSDYFTIYMQTANKEEPSWFYFSFRNGVMSVLSSVKDFNVQLSEIKSKDRQQKEKNLFYQFQPGNRIKKDNFVARMQGQTGY